MSRATQKLTASGAALIAIGCWATVHVILFEASVLAVVAFPSLIMGVVVLIKADRRSCQEARQHKQITARAARQVLTLGATRDRLAKKMKTDINMVRRLKKTGDDKRAGKEPKVKKSRYLSYYCRFCNWEGVRFIRKKNGQRICPACRQPVTKVT